MQRLRISVKWEKEFDELCILVSDAIAHQDASANRLIIALRLSQIARIFDEAMVCG